MTKLYRPSNGTEGEIFEAEWCENCVYELPVREREDFENGCQILTNALWNGIGDKDYPKEWIYGDDGVPKCTAFKKVD
jgi:hypothetical protein